MSGEARRIAVYAESVNGITLRQACTICAAGVKFQYPEERHGKDLPKHCDRHFLRIVSDDRRSTGRATAYFGPAG